MKVVVYWDVLLFLARKAAETKSPEDVKKHKDYEALCLSPDTTLILYSI